MSNKYQAYAKYKDSGVEWLGEIPNHWMSTELKRYSVVQGGYAFSSDSFIEAGKAVIRIGDIKQDGSVSLESCKYIKSENADQYSQYQVNNGDLLMAMTGATIGKVGRFKENEPALLNQRVGSFKCNRIYLNYRFFWYVLNSSGYQEYIKITAFGGAQPNISDSGMVGYQSAFPLENEQTKIAQFLDHETAKIDTLIEKQRRLIELLKEKRQAVISHAVTKGLNPNAPMKDSGVEWLGEVPEHWKLIKVSYVGQILNGSTPDKNNLSYWTDGTIPWLSSSCLNSDIINEPSSYITKNAYDSSSVELIPSGALLVGMVGQGKTRGTSAILSIDSCINQNMAAIIPNSKININFIFYIFQSMYQDLRELGRGGNQAALNCEIIASVRIPLPSIEEQNKIVRFLENLLNKLELASHLGLEQIALLQERRTALISAAVTGKIDVRHWQGECA
ncbi:MAG: restriction endonuclease subunit S [Methylococcaceae bacterium]|nr:restriction endonuclease subunit S [Methylococcaceae bacterium]